jgi:MFS family permease
MKKSEELSLKKRALKTSIQEGSAASISAGVVNNYTTPFLLSLNASNLQIGLLSAISGIVMPITQIFSNKLIYKYSRKKIVFLFVLLQTLAWLPLAISALLAWKGYPFSTLLYSAIIAYTLIIIFGGISHIAWFSWMGDLVNKNKRGKYFAKRNIATGIIELLAVGFATLLMKQVENTNYLFVGFASLFITAFIFRVLSLKLLLDQYCPKKRIDEKIERPIKLILKQNRAFKSFANYQLFFNFAIMIASPFFAVYMLRELHFNYLTFISVSITSTIFYLLFTPWAGKISDKYGNALLLKIANLCFILTPLLWLVSTNPIYLALVPQLMAGIANAAFIISFSNFVYVSLPKGDVSKGLSYTNLLVGIGTFAGSIVGGLLLNYFSIPFLDKFVFVFLLAAALRFAVAMIFNSKLKDSAKSKKIPPLYLSITHPFRTITAEMGSLVVLIENKETEGLKVLDDSFKNVFQKEKRRKLSKL